MPDGFVRMRSGEARPVFAQETVATGMLTIAVAPAPVVTLYDALGNALTDFSAVPTTGYDAAALAAPRVWFVLNTAALPIGYYTLVFTFTAIGSDGTTRIYEPNMEIQVVDIRA